MTVPTDLTPAELRTAEARLREMAGEFTSAGTLRTPRWREVFQRTWRHPYVPAYYPDLRSPLVTAADVERRAEWLSAVYSNRTLITKVIHVPSRPGRTPASYPAFTSSSTLPSLMLTMLEALEVADDSRVMEIGTGSGYNAALLCERLGSKHVTSVDIDPELVELAGARLAANGYTPTLAPVDGSAGYPDAAPYDRIVATCSVRAIPPAWLQQATPGGIIMADVRGPFEGNVVQLVVGDHRAAAGRFLPSYASFMPLRHALDGPSPKDRPRLADDAVDTVSDIDPKLLHENHHFRFVLQWHLPDVNWWYAYAEDGDTGTHLEASDGSAALAWHTLGDDGFLVRQAGPRRLWDRVEAAHEFWQRTGRPHRDCFGITATATSQYVWYEHPESEYRWPLLAPVDSRAAVPTG